VHNLVHREVLVPDGVSFTSRRAPDEQDREFLASTDNWFRPTMLKTGPDGALYIADFYRFVLEHPEWIAPETQAGLDLRAGADKGRLWRVVPVGQPRRQVPNLAKLNTTQLVAALDSPSGWQRDTAQRLLVERQDKAAVEGLKRLTVEAKEPKVRVQALCTLEAFHKAAMPVEGNAREVTWLEPTIEAAMKDSSAPVREHAIRVSEALVRFPRPLANNATNVPCFLAPTNEGDARVRFQMAFTAGEFRDTKAQVALDQLARTSHDDPKLRTAVQSSYPKHAAALLSDMFASDAVLWAAIDKQTVEELTAYIASASSVGDLQAAFTKTFGPRNGQYHHWQLSALNRMLDALDIRIVGGEEADAAKLRQGLQVIAPLFAFARSNVIGMGEFVPKSATFIGLLGRGPDGRAEDLATLANLLKPQQRWELRSAAVAQLTKLGGDDAANALLADWKAHSPAVREAVLGALLSRPLWVALVLDSLERGQIALTQVSLAQRQRLVTYPLDGMRARAVKLFAATRPERQKVLKDYAVVATLTGSETRGRELFTKNCGVCHKLKGEGREIGPDLGQVTARDTDWLLTAILDPNAAVEARYLGYTAETKSGREFTGIITAETPNNLVMRGADGTEETILRTDLKQLLGSGLSLMPEGMEAALKPQDMADLLAFIRAK